MKTLAQVDFDRYAPLNVKEELKESTFKALYTYWSQALERLGLPCKTDVDGFVTDIDTLGAGYLIENVQWSGNLPEDLDFSNPEEDDRLMTLGQLLNSRENEVNLFQFQINPKGVEKILSDKDHGLLKGAYLVSPIEVVKVPRSESFIIGGGRHRLVALATMFKVVRHYENMLVYVTPSYAKSQMEIANYVELSNSTRSMTKVEVSMLNSAAKGENLTIFSSPEEFFATARKYSATAELKDLSRRLWPTLLANSVVGQATSTNAIGDIGYGFLAKLCRGLNQVHGAGADKCLLLVEDGVEGPKQVFEAITAHAVDLLTNNWNAYVVELREPVKDRSTNEQKTDSDGNPLFKFNAAYKANAISQLLYEVVMEDVSDKLGQIVEAERERVAAKKKQNVEDNKIKALERTVNTLATSIQQFQSLNIAVPDSMMQQIEQKRAELRAEIDKASGNRTEVPETVHDELADLLA